MAKKYEVSYDCAQRWLAERHMVSIRKASVVLTDVPRSSTYQIKRFEEVNFQALCNYDAAVFGYKRNTFLARWLQSSITRVAVDNTHTIIGYGAARQLYDQDGYRAGPIFCGSLDVAKSLLKEILEEITESQRLEEGFVIFDFPVGANAEANELALLLDGKVTLECMFMSSTHRQLPKSDFNKWIAITSMETG